MIDIPVRSNRREEIIDITETVRKGIKEITNSGALLIFCPHTTAGLMINEHDDPSVAHDIRETLSRIIPHIAKYSHLEGNSDAHIKTAIIGSSLLIPIINGEIILGRWQGIFFCEFDGPRNRKIILSFLQNK